MNFFRSMSREVIDNYIGSGNSLFAGTIGPAEALMLPFDWIFAETVLKASATFGIRWSFYLKSDLDAMEATQRWLLTSQRPNNMLCNAVDCFLSTQ